MRFEYWATKATNKCAVVLKNGRIAPVGQEPPHYRGFTIKLKHNTLGKTPLDE